MAGADVSPTLSEPFFEGSAAVPPYFPKTAIGVDGRPYMLDLASQAYSRETVEVVQQRNTTDPRDVLLLPQGIWRQQASDWSFGAGQSNLDREGALPSRFYTSYGVDVWDRWKMCLLPKTNLLAGTDSLTGPVWLSTYDSWLAVINGTVIRWYASPTASAATSITPDSGQAIIAMSSTGHVVTTLHEDGQVYTTPGPVTSTRWGTYSYPSASFIGWAKDYLLIGDRNFLRDITGASASLIYTHPDAGFRWVDACDGSNVIYAIGSLADHSVIHKVGIRDDGTGLIPAAVAATLPDGEIGKSISSYLGFVFVGTNKGVRMAQSDANGDLTLGALIPTGGDVWCFEGQDRFVWFGDPAVDGTYDNTPVDAVSDLFPDTVVPGLGRMDLTTFTVTNLTPAYATDIVAAEETSDAVRSVVTWQDLRAFAVDNGGVYVESTDRMEGGWLREGVISYSVEDLKTALYQQVKVAPDSTGTVYVDLSFDESGWIRKAHVNLSTPGLARSVSLDGFQFSGVEPRFVLVREPGADDVGPTLSRWEIRSSPVRGAAWRWVLPIRIGEQITPNDTTAVMDVADAYAHLTGLVESGVLFTFQEWGISYPVVARNAKWIAEQVTSQDVGWQGVFLLTIESVV